MLWVGPPAECFHAQVELTVRRREEFLGELIAVLQVCQEVNPGPLRLVPSSLKFEPMSGYQEIGSTVLRMIRTVGEDPIPESLQVCHRCTYPYLNTRRITVEYITCWLTTLIHCVFLLHVFTCANTEDDMPCERQA